MIKDEERLVRLRFLRRSQDLEAFPVGTGTRSGDQPIKIEKLLSAPRIITYNSSNEREMPLYFLADSIRKANARSNYQLNAYIDGEVVNIFHPIIEAVIFCNINPRDYKRLSTIQKEKGVY